MYFLWEAGPPLFGHFTMDYMAEPWAWGNATKGPLQLQGPHSAWCTTFLTCLMQVLVAEGQLGPECEGKPWNLILMAVDLGVISLAILCWTMFFPGQKPHSQLTIQQIAERVKTLRKEQREIEEKLSRSAKAIRETRQIMKRTKKNNLKLESIGELCEEKRNILDRKNHILSDTIGKLHALMAAHSKENSQGREEDLPKPVKAVSLPESPTLALQEELRSAQHLLTATKSQLEEQVSKLQRKCDALLSTEAELREELTHVRQKTNTMHMLCDRREEALKQRIKQLEVEVRDLKQGLATTERRAGADGNGASGANSNYQDTRGKHLKWANTPSKNLGVEGKAAAEMLGEHLPAQPPAALSSARPRAGDHPGGALEPGARGALGVRNILPSSPLNCVPTEEQGAMAGRGSLPYRGPPLRYTLVEGAPPSLRMPGPPPHPSRRPRAPPPSLMKPGPPPPPEVMAGPPPTPWWLMPGPPPHPQVMPGPRRPPTQRMPGPPPWMMPPPAPWMVSQLPPPRCFPFGPCPVLPHFASHFCPPPCRGGEVPGFPPGGWGPPYTFRPAPMSRSMTCV